MLEALKKLPNVRRIAVICFNDDAAIGALAAVRRLQREEDVVIVGQGADRRVRDELRSPGSRIIGSTGLRAGTVRRKAHLTGAEDFAR